MQTGEYFWFQKKYCRLINRDEGAEWFHARHLKTQEQIKLYLYWEVNHRIDQGDAADVPKLTPEEEAKLFVYVKDHTPEIKPHAKVEVEERMIQV